MTSTATIDITPAPSNPGAPPHAVGPARTAPVADPQDGRHDFDFLFGQWTVHNRRLAARLAGSTEWLEFEATNDCHPNLDGIANEDEFRTYYWEGFRGMSFRFFDPAEKTWSIYWADNRMGALQPPVVGSFQGDRGIFLGPDVYAGKPILVRFIWSRITTPGPRWEQAFSEDDGATWEMNWIMDFTRDESGGSAE
ncbi:MAG TPA: hypothetical protein VGS22_00755 [Thermoanaerobaculia bacterium]|jgi:hypothetical protein|nr:hypothetical protein [Thermoanaerobaculia bacterium]